MKISNKLIIIGCILFFITSCNESFLEKEPFGSISEKPLATLTGVNGVLIGAYSLLDGGGAVGGGFRSGWTVLLAPDDARIGTESGASTINTFLIDESMSEFNNRWSFLYSAIQRCNDVLKILPKVNDIKPEEAIQIEAEAKFLRGIYYLKLAMLWKNVPWIDESISYSENNYFVSNTEPIYPKIESDFKFAADNLTATKSDVGRANLWAAKAFLAKTYMFQNKFSEAIFLLEDIILNGITSSGVKYELLAHYGDNFRSSMKNSSESVFAVQMSVNDGGNGRNGNPMDFYNGTFGGPATCCYGWYQPTFDLVDAYQTDEDTGLPLLDEYQNTPVPHDQGLTSEEPFTPYTGTLDPRLDHSVGRRGIPYLDWGVHPGKAWVRNQFTSGPYSSIKNIAAQANVNSEREGGYATSNPLNMIRFADVLLWAAECEVEIGSLAKAEEYVNMIRVRASNPAGWVHTYIDPNDPGAGFTDIPAANYKVEAYTGQFELNGKSYARKAVRFERRLELAMEHQRFFDMRRYDGNDFDQAARHNWVMQREGNEPGFNPASNYKQGEFIKGKHELYPIPLQQIELSEVNGASVLVQNPNY